MIRHCRVDSWRFPSGDWVWRRQNERWPARFLFVAVRRDGSVLGTTFYSVAAATKTLFEARQRETAAAE